MLLKIVKDNPVLIGWLISVLARQGAKYGVNVDMGMIIDLTSLVDLAIGLYVRAKVTPNAKVDEKVQRMSQAPGINVPVEDAGEDLGEAPVERGKKP